MTVISASSVRCKTLMDGSLDITIRVEPRDSVDAFRLFSAPGTPMALAALKTAAQQEDYSEQVPGAPEQTSEYSEPSKGGPLAKWAAMRCQDVRFLAWLGAHDEKHARLEILLRCSISSRAELDSNPEAAGLFDKHFRRPWADHCKRMGWVD